MNDNRTDLGDMTLAQIKEIKSELRKKIKDAVEDAIIGFEKLYDTGGIEISLERSVEQMAMETYANDNRIFHIYYDIDIQFSKEL